MRIDGVTVCVGEPYERMFRRLAAVWAKTLDSLTVVKMGPPDETTSKHGLLADLKIVSTLVFTANGAHFNKGAALNVGIAAAEPSDWILAIDCDIEPPANWRTLAEPLLEAGNLYGAPRVNTNGRCVPRFEPYGYFQLWHSTDPQAPRPPFSEAYGHCGRYDTVFLKHWPAHSRRSLPFSVTHHGEACRHWCGVSNDAAMQELMRGGVAAYRMRDEKIQGAESAR